MMLRYIIIDKRQYSWCNYENMEYEPITLEIWLAEYSNSTCVESSQ